MRVRNLRFMSSSRAIGLLAGLCLLAGCIDDDPETARIVVEGSPSVSIPLVVSTNFVIRFTDDEREADPLTADTVFLTDDFDRDYNIATYRRIYVLLQNDDSIPATMRMQVFVNGDVVYDAEKSIADGDFLQYLFASRSSF